MNILITGGSGFIGSWVVQKLLNKGHKIWILDNLSNGREKNLAKIKEHKDIAVFYKGDIKDKKILKDIFSNNIEICYHLAASINVQDSIDNPVTTYENDATGTINVLEECRKHSTRLVYMSTCMVYDMATENKGITELSPLKAASPYAGAKIAGEFLAQSYFHAYELPVTIVRPFNTYGPRQKSNGEGGVVSIFIQKELNDEDLLIYGTGDQTRDLLYVEDCADFVVECGFNKKAIGEVINAGTQSDVSINELAQTICDKKQKIKHVKHIHPQSEIPKLLCNAQKAYDLLGWKATTNLKEGIRKTKEWIINNH